MNPFDLDDDVPIVITHERVPVSQIYDFHVDRLVENSKHLSLALAVMVLIERHPGSFERELIERIKKSLGISEDILEEVLNELIEVKYLVKT